MFSAEVPDPRPKYLSDRLLGCYQNDGPFWLIDNILAPIIQRYQKETIF